MEKTKKDSGWLKWEGGECPVPEQTAVEYETRKGSIGVGIARDLRWKHLPLDGDILAYRILKEAPKPTSPEDIAPKLWNACKDVLNEEALEALREVILDTENHKNINFKDSSGVEYSFVWADTADGKKFWYDVHNRVYDKIEKSPTSDANNTDVEKSVDTPIQEDIGSAATSKPIKSDGGSSEYYKISIKTLHGLVDVEVNDVIYGMVGGDFDLANILKAARRMYLASKGCGKEGVDIAYDARKIVWFCDDFAQRFGNGF